MSIELRNATTDDRERCVQLLAVLSSTPEARGKNVGGLLVQQTIENAGTRGCADYGLYLVETTEHNRPFYEKYGFSATGTEMRQKLTG